MCKNLPNDVLKATGFAHESAPTPAPAPAPEPTPAPAPHPAVPMTADNSAASLNGVNDAFSIFGPGYYSGKQEAYTNQYAPTLTDQYNSEKSRLNGALASRGVSGSSIDAGANKALNDTFSSTKNQYGDTFSSWAKQQQDAIDAARTGFLTQATPGSDPNALTSAAHAKAFELYNATPTYSPVGNVFASVVDPLAQVGTTNTAPANYAPSGNAKLAGQTAKQSTGQVAFAGGPSAKVIN